MSIQELLQEASKKLLPVLKEKDQCHLESEILLAHVLKQERPWLITHQTFVPAKRLRQAFQKLVLRRLDLEPVAYLTRECRFFNRSFYVDERVLIPRPETEELVIAALSFIKDPAKTCVLEVGVGSGAIAISLKKERSTLHVIATDIDRRALVIARRNARTLKANVQFLHADLLAPSLQKQLTAARVSHLLLVANLPYVPLSDRKTLMSDVVNFEPHHALFARQHGMALNKRLLKEAAHFYRQDGRPLSLVLEFDPPQATALKKEASRLFPQATVIVRQDTCGRDRLLLISLLGS